MTDTLAKQFSLVDIYSRKGRYELTLKKLEEAKRYQNKSVVQDDIFFSYQYHFYRKENDYDAKNLQEMSDSLEVSFIIRKLRAACFMVNHQSVYKKEYKYGLLEPLIEYIEKNNLIRIKAIAIYYYCYKSITNPEMEEYYYTFRNVLFEFNRILPQEEMRNNYLLAINYCITRLNQFKEKFRLEVFELYRRGIENRALFTKKNELDSTIFRNTVNTGTIVKEFDWIKLFIQDYQKYLPSEQKEETVTFSLGKYHFEKGEYDSARDHLMHINPSSVNLNLMIKSMLIRIYYSEDEFQLLDALLESMKVYINRKKTLVAQHKVPFLNLIKYTKKLVRINPYDKEAKAKLRQEIVAAKSLISKDWFLEQVDNL